MRISALFYREFWTSFKGHRIGRPRRCQERGGASARKGIRLDAWLRLLECRVMNEPGEQRSVANETRRAANRPHHLGRPPAAPIFEPPAD